MNFQKTGDTYILILYLKKGKEGDYQEIRIVILKVCFFLSLKHCGYFLHELICSIIVERIGF